MLKIVEEEVAEATKKYLTISIKGYILRRGYNREVQPI